jgi:hypothetical protein
MEFNWSILAWIAGLVFVYVFGLFEGRNQGYKKRKKEEAEQKKDAPATESKPITVQVDDPGLLRIRNEDGYLTLDLDGARVNTAALSAEQRKRLIEMLTIMRPWLEGKPVHAPVPATPPPAAPSQPQPQPPAVVSTPPPPRPAIDPIPSRPISAPQPATIAKEDRPVSSPTSIVGQIDQVLQARLVGTPLEERGIFLTQSPEGGVMVYVGLTKYMSIDDVPDAEIKAAIRAAIAEWENKYTPGL